MGMNMMSARVKAKCVINHISSPLPYVTVFLCHLFASFAVDTGAEVNIVDKFKFEPKLYKSTTRLMPYGGGAK